MVFSLNFYAGQAIAVEPSDPMLKLIEILYEKGSLTEDEYQLMRQAAQQRQSPDVVMDTTDPDRIVEEKLTAANADRSKVTTRENSDFNLPMANSSGVWAGECKVILRCTMMKPILPAILCRSPIEL